MHFVCDTITIEIKWDRDRKKKKTRRNYNKLFVICSIDKIFRRKIQNAFSFVFVSVAELNENMRFFFSVGQSSQTKRNEAIISNKFYIVWFCGYI